MHPEGDRTPQSPMQVIPVDVRPYDPLDQVRDIMQYVKMGLDLLGPITAEILRDQVAKKALETRLEASGGVVKPDAAARDAYAIADAFLRARAEIHPDR